MNAPRFESYSPTSARAFRQVDQLSGSVAELRDANERLTRLYDADERIITEVTAQRDDWQRKCDDARERIAELAEVAQGLRNELARCVREMGALKADLATARAEASA